MATLPAATATTYSYDSIQDIPEIFHRRSGNDGDQVGSVAEHENRSQPWRLVKIAAFVAGVALYVVTVSVGLLSPKQRPSQEVSMPADGKVEGDRVPLLSMEQQPLPRASSPTARCEYVIDIMESQNSGKTREEKIEAYPIEAQDANVFYRATAHIFWDDFVARRWAPRLLERFDAKLRDGTELQEKTTFTWITGDQHLSNFGAWRSRSGKIVFGINDFDEAAIYDFHVDVVRLAVSIYNHATTNGFKSEKKLRKIIRTFTETYYETVRGYVGNEDALTFELTHDTAEGKLRDFLEDTENDKSHEFQLSKYTDFNGTFLFNDHTRLVEVEPDLEDDIRKAFTQFQYGATMMKTGWHVLPWDDDYFAVVDVARRLYSGIGSYGVDRFYVLLNGADGKNILLDVKYEPKGVVNKVLTEADKAWYGIAFRNEAHRAVEAQRRLTSFTDPFTGWVMIRGRPFVVRQKSPWKAAFNIAKLTKYDDFKTFIKMVAKVTATCHTRGTDGKSPGEFKHVIEQILEPLDKRESWGDTIFELASKYSEQVYLDYLCFKDYVATEYSP